MQAMLCVAEGCWMSLQESRLPSDLSWSCRELRAVVRQTQIEVKTQCTTIFQSPRFYQGSNVCSSVTFTSLQVAKRAAEQERTLTSCQDMRTNFLHYSCVPLPIVSPWFRRPSALCDSMSAQNVPVWATQLPNTQCQQWKIGHCSAAGNCSAAGLMIIFDGLFVIMWDCL